MVALAISKSIFHFPPTGRCPHNTTVVLNQEKINEIKAKLLQVGIFFLIQLFAGATLVLKKFSSYQF